MGPGRGNGGQDLWVITTFFNPMGYRSRRRNYHLFRKELAAPLLTVELGREGACELEEGDADRLVRIPSGDTLWQKERLLNVALEHLPGDCRKVAWVDCDLLFLRRDWAAAASEALEHVPLVQPFTRVYHLRRDADPARPVPAEAASWRESIASQYARGALNLGCLKGSGPLDFSPGQAWAMHRADLDSVGFYDASIIGAGTLLTAAAAIGRFTDAAGRLRMNGKQCEHYFRWAKAFHALVEGRIAAMEGDVYHLWHGDRKNRGYGTRHLGMEAFDFDPERDIAVDGKGSWRWNSGKKDLHRYVERHFKNRLEDGAEDDAQEMQGETS